MNALLLAALVAGQAGPPPPTGPQAPLSLLLRAQLLERVGHSAYLGTPTGRYTYYDNVLRPLAQGNVNLRGFVGLLSYSPQILVRVPGVETRGPIVLHRLNLQATLSGHDAWKLGAQARAAVGTLDLSNAAEVLDEVSGNFPPGSAGAFAQYLSLRANLTGERRFWSDYRYLSQLALIQLSSPGTGATFALDPGIDSGNGQVDVGFKTQRRVELSNTVQVTLRNQDVLRLLVLLSAAEFPSVSTYLGLAPSLAWDTKLGRRTALALRGGAMKYWSNPYPGRYLSPRYIPIAEVGLTRTFEDFGLPRLTGNLKVTMGPYYDQLFGLLWPRSQATLATTYAFSRAWAWTTTLRAFTYEYWDGRHFLTLEKGRYKTVGFLQTSLKFIQSPQWTFEGMLRFSDRHQVPSNTAPFGHRQEIYSYLGATYSQTVD